MGRGLCVHGPSTELRRSRRVSIFLGYYRGESSLIEEIGIYTDNYQGSSKVAHRRSRRIHRLILV
jgi:hypothetical protein